jgi:hypothetical protein
VEFERSFLLNLYRVDESIKSDSSLNQFFNESMNRFFKIPLGFSDRKQPTGAAANRTNMAAKPRLALGPAITFTGGTGHYGFFNLYGSVPKTGQALLLGDRPGAGA